MLKFSNTKQPKKLFKMKTLKIVIFLLFTLTVNNLIAQVAITSDGSTADGSAMLDIKSSDKGLLMPRLSNTQIEDITNPADGLLVYSLDDHRFYFYDAGSTIWRKLGIDSGTVLPGGCSGTFTDLRDNTEYEIVQIGDQCWMAENLNIGTMINSTNGGTNSDGMQTNNSTIEKYCYDNQTSNCDTYGGLYQWNEMMEYTTLPGAQGICPDGWHVPTDTEWCTLKNAVNAGTIECGVNGEWQGTDGGGHLKSTGTSLWWNPNEGADNSSGFTALPGGARVESGGFGDQLLSALFWCSDYKDASNAWFHMLSYAHTEIYRSDFDKIRGYSVRCILD
jgi:uncharacterized protein (TIGR02145 family)